ncbi:alpha/beta hydrolase [Bacillus piscicola]|uniref:alpha/beta hydrolase n=1 Tax=Bacillus piscicola TaxID=1632684 RepID=UPI001F08DA5A|nr:alpha/beta hydrolase [Bacillus piscicola]
MGEYITLKNGHNLYVHDTPGEEGTIIAAHGLTGNHHQFHHYQEALSGTYRFVSYDIRGRGNSDPAPQDSSIFTHADDLVDLINTLGIKKPILMGYSMGAYICAITASRLPDVEALILLDGAGNADDTARELVLPSLGRMKQSYPSAEDYTEATKKLYTNLKIDWDDTLEEIVRYEIQPDGKDWRHKSTAEVMERDFESFYSFSPHESGKALTCPVLLVIATGSIGGKRSLFTKESYTETQEAMRNLQTEITPVNHYELVFNKQPGLLRQIKSFLSKREVKS